jgi:hypothetical protein
VRCRVDRHRARRNFRKRARRQDIDKTRTRTAAPRRLLIGTAWSEASARSNAGDRAAPRVNVPKKWGPPTREFQEITPHPVLSRTPLKPPPLLFDLLVQSEARYAYGSSMSAFGGNTVLAMKIAENTTT